MTSREGAGSYLRRAGVIYEEAERLAQKGVWHLAVRVMPIEVKPPTPAGDGGRFFALAVPYCQEPL